MELAYDVEHSGSMLKTTARSRSGIGAWESWGGLPWKLKGCRGREPPRPQTNTASCRDPEAGLPVPDAGLAMLRRNQNRTSVWATPMRSRVSPAPSLAGSTSRVADWHEILNFVHFRQKHAQIFGSVFDISRCSCRGLYRTPDRILNDLPRPTKRAESGVFRANALLGRSEPRSDDVP